MTLNEKITVTINSSIKECESHLKHLNRASGLLNDIFPLTFESMANINDERTAQIDQFIYRFMKLQDSMGTRLLPSIYYYIQGSSGPVPFLDILASLEKFEVITSENDWQFFRNLRNTLAHDYPESTDQTVLTLNMLYKEWRRMESIFIRARDYCLSRILKK